MNTKHEEKEPSLPNHTAVSSPEGQPFPLEREDEWKKASQLIKDGWDVEMQNAGNPREFPLKVQKEHRTIPDYRIEGAFSKGWALLACTEQP